LFLKTLSYGNCLNWAAGCRILGTFDVVLANCFRLTLSIHLEAFRAKSDTGAAANASDVINLDHNIIIKK
jgi:hypothetical protein